MRGWLGLAIQKSGNRGRVSESTITSSESKSIHGSVIGSKNDAISIKPTSQRKIEANRRNGLRSTGPKTQRGKRTVSRNATRHGLLAREAVITKGQGAENQQEFAELLRGLLEDYQPVGIGEELLVQKIAVCHWRLARVLRFEMGETRRHLDHIGVSHTLKKIDQANRNVILLQLLEFQRFYECDTAEDNLSMKEWPDATQSLQNALRTDPIGIKYLGVCWRRPRSRFSRRAAGRTKRFRS